MTVQQLLDSITEYLKRAPEAAGDPVVVLAANGELVLADGAVALVTEVEYAYGSVPAMEEGPLFALYA